MYREEEITEKGFATQGSFSTRKGGAGEGGERLMIVKREDMQERMVRGDRRSTIFYICEAWWRVIGQPP